MSTSMEGWLTKQGGSIKTWKKRWCVLKDGKLHYHKTKNGELQGSIVLKTVSSIHIDNSKKKKHCFEISTPERAYYLFADSDQQMKSWMNALLSNTGIKDGGKAPNLASSNGSINSKTSSPQVGNDASDDSEEDTTFGKDKNSTINGVKVCEEDFQCLKVIGRGNFGKVLQVKKKDSGQIYAMKVLNKKTIMERKEEEHTRTEKSILMKLEHPFLVHLYFSFQTPEKLYFVMDYINGGELFFHLQKEKRFTPERVRFYCAEIVMGLEYLHKQGVVYRDLKPENILLTADGHICMTDFGISKEGLNAKDDRTATFCGTPEYLAPEVLEGKGYGKGVDWWSFGTLMFEMLTGLPPFYSEDVQKMYSKIIHETLNFPKTMAPDARSLLTGLLERDPTKRLSDPEKIKQHAYFESINWDDLYSKKIKPTFIPPVKDAKDTSQFDPSFTLEEPTAGSVSADSLMAPGDHPVNFQGFTYVANGTLK